MSTNIEKVFSEYEARKTGIKFESQDSYIPADCVGSCEMETEVRVMRKKCRGVERKTRAKGTGKGKVKMKLHIPFNIYLLMFGMKDDELIDGVFSYGEGSVHEGFSIVQEIFDEDENEKLRAYPNCIVETGPVSKIENGAEEVAEVEIEVSFMPDNYGKGMYEALAENLEESIIEEWLTNFTPELVRKEGGATTFIRINITSGTLEYPTLNKNDSGQSGVYAMIGSALELKLVPDEGYTYPNSLTVMENGTALTSGKDYLYNSDTGIIILNTVRKTTGGTSISTTCKAAT